MYCYKMVINLKDLIYNTSTHYRTYLQIGITNTFAMPNHFYYNRNQIETPFSCYFRLYQHKWMYCYNMDIILKDTVPALTEL